MPAPASCPPKTSGDTPLPRYSLTFRVNKQRHLFVSLEPVTIVYEQIRRAAAENHLAIAAYCFMPDHLHLLVTATRPAASYPRFLARAKQYTGVAYARACGGRRLWERRIYARELLDDEDLWTVARYIVSNPVRAGLVDRLADYPFVGSELYAVAASGEWRSPRRDADCARGSGERSVDSPNG